MDKTQDKNLMVEIRISCEVIDQNTGEGYNPRDDNGNERCLEEIIVYAMEDEVDALIDYEMITKYAENIRMGV